MSAAAAPARIERVSTLELFFDLVFVLTITQLTRVLSHDPDIEHLARVAVMLAVIFWMYGGYAWLTNAVAADSARRRLVLLGGMAGFLVVALAIPRAFDGGGLAFGLAYALVVAVHIGLFTRAMSVRSAADLWQLGRFNGTGAALVLVGGALGGSAQLVAWFAVAIGLWCVTPYLGPAGAFDIGAAHFVERHGLVVIVAIGESVVALGLGLSDLELDASLTVVAVLGLALSACLWWTYFGGDHDDRAELALLAAPVARRAILAIQAYGWAHLALLLGVIAIAAAEEEAAKHPFDVLTGGHATALGAGAALYLVGDAAFRRLLRIGPAHRRLLAAAATLATIVVGSSVAAAAQMAVLVVIFAALFAVESRRSPAANAT